MNGLDWQTWTMRLVGGIDQGQDERTLDPPGLSKCIDAQFDKVGAISTRYPYDDAMSDILGGGTIADARRIVRNGDELLLFTKDTLYSWNAQLSKWVSKGTHLACKLTEKTVFVSGGEQTNVDRAELSNIIVYAWDESGGTYTGVIDKTTGSVLRAPTAYGTGYTKPRLVALATKILLFMTNANTGFLNVLAIDPADPATGLAGAATAIGSAAHNNLYDATKIIGADTAVMVQQLSPSTSYGISTVTAGLTIVNSTKARVADGVLAVSSSPTGTHVQVVRMDGLGIEGDYIAVAALADVTVNQAIHTTLDGASQIAVAHRSTTDSGQYRCYIFWSDATRSTDGAVSWRSWVTWVDTGGSFGTAASLVRRLDIGSRAFDHEGRVFVWGIWGTAAGTYGWGGQLQNASYLYRDDGFLVAKAAMNRGAGFLTAGHLPGVQSIATNTYAYCGLERAVFGELTSSNFSGKRPRDAVFTFDSDDARRCARIGRTLYITGGEILQYDGVRLVESGFHVWPWYFALTVVNGGGSVENGTYAYKLSYASQNAQAERDRSAAVRIETAVVSSAPDEIRVSVASALYVTHKPLVSCEVWRTLKDPVDESPYYLSSTSDPSDTSNPNRHLPNDTTASSLPTMNDYLADASLDDFGAFPQDVTLPSLAPPASSFILATDARLFLAGVAGEPDSVWYSKQRGADDAAAFHGALVATVPISGGEITGLGYMNRTPVVFRERAIYALDGIGFDNTGGGQNYEAREIPGGIGAVNHESIASSDKGLVFKSSKGWYLLNHGWQLEYIGAKVQDYDDEEVLAVDVIEAKHEIRILTASRMLVLNTDVGQWGEWTIADGVHSCIWNGAHLYLTDEGPKQQLTTYTDLTYGMDVETAWIKLTDLQGMKRTRWFEILGEIRSAHRVRVRVARDYWVDGADTYFDDEEWGLNTTTAGAPLRLRHGPSIQQLQALKIRLTAVNVDGSGDPPDGEALKLASIALECGFKRGLFRHLPAAQKQ
jgi:hypothetical protein